MCGDLVMELKDIKILDISKLIIKKYIKDNNINTYGLDDFVKYKSIAEIRQLNKVLEYYKNNNIIHIEVLNDTTRIFYFNLQNNKRVMLMDVWKSNDGIWILEKNIIWDYRQE